MVGGRWLKALWTDFPGYLKFVFTKCLWTYFVILSESFNLFTVKTPSRLSVLLPVHFIFYILCFIFTFYLSQLSILLRSELSTCTFIMYNIIMMYFVSKIEDCKTCRGNYVWKWSGSAINTIDNLFRIQNSELSECSRMDKVSKVPCNVIMFPFHAFNSILLEMFSFDLYSSLHSLHSTL